MFHSLEGVPTDTILAPATGVERSAVAVLRLSGPKTLLVLNQTFFPDHPVGFTPRRLVPGRLIDPKDGQCLDYCQAVWFPCPRSFTGEDMAEFHLHGSPAVISQTLRLLCDAGSRPALPGEFTQRAFLNGRMDLTQAEAVRDLIASRTAFQSRLALAQLQGSLSKIVAPLKTQLIDVLCRLETALEFSEDHGISVVSEDIPKILQQMANDICRLTKGFQVGRMVREGCCLAIVGRPNVGKSTLFNALTGRDRAIVSEWPGTTRDALYEPAQIGGVPVTLVDTAGLRTTEDPIEQMGIERTREAAAEALITLYVLDGTQPVLDDDRQWFANPHAPNQILVVNKTDIPSVVTRDALSFVPPETAILHVSARTGDGLDALRCAIEKVVRGDTGDIPLIGDLRQQASLNQAESALREGILAIQKGLSEEFIAFHLREGLDALDALTGETVVEDLLRKIFATFCVGK